MWLLALLSVLLSSACWGQQQEFVAASTDVWGADYPRVDARHPPSFPDCHVFYESPGRDNEWQTWRRDLADFVPRLVQQ